MVVAIVFPQCKSTSRKVKFLLSDTLGMTELRNFWVWIGGIFASAIVAWRLPKRSA